MADVKHFDDQFTTNPTSVGGDTDTLNETQKLQLAERANEIYAQQLKYMQDHLASLRSLIQDKENIIENLLLRYDLGIITQDSSRQNGNLGADEIEQTELRRKAEALAQRTILENFELREMVNELRDENFHLRNEIDELKNKIDRQVLQINKWEKSQNTTYTLNRVLRADTENAEDDDQSIPDDLADTTNQLPQTTVSGTSNIRDADALNEAQKLHLVQRGNEIYRQQLKYMQDHLASLRSLIQDKENIIQNLMLRFDLGTNTQDTSRPHGNLEPDDIEQTEVCRKAQALAQKTILENFELREMVKELQDENFHLRNEIYELQDKINQQVLQINKLEKGFDTPNAVQFQSMDKERAALSVNELRDENSRLRNEIYELQNKINRQAVQMNELEKGSYTLIQVLSAEQDHKIQHEDEAKEKEKSHDDFALYEKHSRIVSEWNAVSEKLQKLSDALNRRNDDEKEPVQQQEDFSVDKEIETLERSYRLINQQKIRLRRMANESEKQLQSEVAAKKKEIAIKEPQYDSMKAKRIEKVTLIKKMINECNELITNENTLITELNELRAETASVEEQLEMQKASSNGCADTISLYAAFGEQNQQYIDTISGHYNAQWEPFESKCYEWTTHQLTVWFRKVAASVPTEMNAPDFQSDDVAAYKHQASTNWESVEKKLNGLKLSGKHLPHFGQSIIFVAGIKDVNISTVLISSITQLTQQYSAEFDEIWREKETKWKEWSSEDLTEWLKYQSLHLESGAIDWNRVHAMLNSQNMNGKMLPQMNQALMPFIGISQKDTIDHLVSSINTLMKEYDAKKKNTASKAVNIPSEFLCPISKEVMKDPVIACDGHTYERSEIENYLKQHNKSPLTGEAAEHAFVFPNKAMKKQIDGFLSANNPDTQESSELAAEGVAETGYL